MYGVAQQDPLLRDSRGQNQGVDRAVILPSSGGRIRFQDHSGLGRNLVLAAIFRRGLPVSWLSVTWNLLLTLEASLWSLHMGLPPQGQQCSA